MFLDATQRTCEHVRTRANKPYVPDCLSNILDCVAGQVFRFALLVWAGYYIHRVSFTGENRLEHETNHLILAA